jgi:hypothetical protein
MEAPNNNGNGSSKIRIDTTFLVRTAIWVVVTTATLAIGWGKMLTVETANVAYQKKDVSNLLWEQNGKDHTALMKELEKISGQLKDMQTDLNTHRITGK